MTDVGSDGLRALRYVSARERKPGPAAHEVSRRAQGVGGDRPRDRRAASFPRRVYPLLRGAPRDGRRARTRAHEGRGATAARQERAWRALLQDASRSRRASPGSSPNIEGLITTRTGTATASRHSPGRATGRDRHGRPHRRDLRARDQPPQQAPDRRADPARLQRPADSRAPPPRLQTDSQSPADLPPQRRPDLRADQHHRDRAPDLRTDRNRDSQSARRDRTAPRPAAREPPAKPTGRNILSVFQGLGLTYTHAGIQLDRLTHTQRRVLELLQITPPGRANTAPYLPSAENGLAELHKQA